jgi:hypothetical protein
MKIPRPLRFRFLTLSFALALLPARVAGLEWKKMAGPEGGDIQGLAASGDTVVAATAQGDYYRSVDAGKTWVPLYRSLIPEDVEYTPMKWVSEPFFFGNRILASAAQGRRQASRIRIPGDFAIHGRRPHLGSADRCASSSYPINGGASGR